MSDNSAMIAATSVLLEFAASQMVILTKQAQELSAFKDQSNSPEAWSEISAAINRASAAATELKYAANTITKLTASIQSGSPVGKSLRNRRQA